MIITTKYSIGDKVKYLRKKIIDVKYLCEICGGSGIIHDYKDRIVDCPSCEGAGYLYGEDYTNVEEVGTIYGVCVSDNPWSDDLSVCYRIENHDVYESDIIGEVKEKNS